MLICLSQLVDYDTMGPDKILRFTIEVRDPDFSDTTSVTLTVTDINDNAPIFTPPSQDVTFPENIDIGTSVATFNADDADSGDNKLFE